MSHTLEQDILAPVDMSRSGLRILDSGSAAGTWAYDVARKCSPAAHYFLNTDIDGTIFPDEKPENLKFMQHDTREPFPIDLRNSFDFAHQRNVLPGTYGVPLKQAVQNLADTIKPGGWIQLIELDDDVFPESNGPAYTTFLRLVRHILRTMSVPNVAVQLKPLLEVIGFQNIQEKVFNPQMGQRIVATAPHLYEASVRAPCNAVPQLVVANSRLPEPYVDESALSLDTLEQRLRVELLKIGAESCCRVVWGQKP